MQSYLMRAGKRYAATLVAVLSIGVADAQTTPNPMPTPTATVVTPTSTENIATDAATHDQLRLLRDQLVAAWQKHDVDALLSHVAPNVVVTWQNAEVSRGHAGIRKYYEEVMGGEHPLVTKIDSKITIDDLSVLYGSSTAIAFGSIHDDLTLGGGIARAPFLHAGNSIPLDSRWTATLVKVDGKWMLASYHVSTDVFSNPVLEKAVEVGKMVSIFASVLGLAIGALLAWLVFRRRLKLPR